MQVFVSNVEALAPATLSGYSFVVKVGFFACMDRPAFAKTGLA